jgi:hypothetical protein
MAPLFEKSRSGSRNRSSDGTLVSCFNSAGVEGVLVTWPVNGEDGWHNENCLSRQGVEIKGQHHAA